jgi:hypothetical protein
MHESIALRVIQCDAITRSVSHFERDHMNGLFIDLLCPSHARLRARALSIAHAMILERVQARCVQGERLVVVRMSGVSNNSVVADQAMYGCARLSVVPCASCMLQEATHCH